MLVAAVFLIGCDNKIEKIPKNIDHLVYTTSSLEQGIDEIQALLGVRPVVGGHHPNFGTQNALLSLGESIYLEIIAPDLNLPEPNRGRLFQASYNQESKLTTWVLRTEQIEDLQSMAAKKGLVLGPVSSGKREIPDGTVLSWKLTDPYTMLANGAIPFLISWGDTPHPARAAPKAGQLIEFVIEHPNPAQIVKDLKILNTHVQVTKADKFKLIAKIKTETGIVNLE